MIIYQHKLKYCATLFLTPKRDKEPCAREKFNVKQTKFWPTARFSQNCNVKADKTGEFRK